MNQTVKSIKDKNILLIISGGIAAYKSLELIRLLRRDGTNVRCILTNGGAQFITPLSVASLSEQPVYTDLWSLKDETEMGHIRLSREADLIVVAPASANMIAKMTYGLADDLATTTILASDKPVLIAPAMNQQMWSNPATQENIATLKRRGILQIGPNAGDMACGETGMGRMAEPEEIFQAIKNILSKKKVLSGFKALVTSGPTFEPLDPVRFIGNRSSGKQGHAIAAALAASGADVTLISGPVSSEAMSSLPICHPREGGDSAKPGGIKLMNVTTAVEMLKACEQALPVDIAVFAAAVSDWAPAKPQNQKIKKGAGKSPPAIALKENPDILKAIAAHEKRPALVIGFAAETENLIQNAKEKLKWKNCDWILANDVSKETFGADQNHVHLITKSGIEDWKNQSKQAVAEKLAGHIAAHFGKPKSLPRAAG